ncbi:hypothetical protein L9F63_000088, partial [Diploptera punctata]
SIFRTLLPLPNLFDNAQNERRYSWTQNDKTPRNDIMGSPFTPREGMVEILAPKALFKIRMWFCLKGLFFNIILNSSSFLSWMLIFFLKSFRINNCFNFWYPDLHGLPRLPLQAGLLVLPTWRTSNTYVKVGYILIIKKYVQAIMLTTLLRFSSGCTLKKNRPTILSSYTKERISTWKTMYDFFVVITTFLFISILAHALIVVVNSFRVTHIHFSSIVAKYLYFLTSISRIRAHILPFFLKWEVFKIDSLGLYLKVHFLTYLKISLWSYGKQICYATFPKTDISAEIRLFVLFLFQPLRNIFWNIS